MCVAILKPKNNTIDDKIIRKCWETNPDGGGLMYVNNGKIIVKKELEDVESFIRKYHESLPFFQSDVILHFRIGTSGLMNLENTHPHKVNENVYMVHNGIIVRCTEVNSKFSDTMKFCKFISNLPSNFTRNKSMIELITGYIGTDKMIFLNRNGDIKIVNENKGIWKDGNWYSNGNWDYTRKKWYHKSSWKSSDDYEIITVDENKTYSKNDDLICIDCDDLIGKYEDHDYDGRCYSCWRLISETARYYGDF